MSHESCLVSRLERFIKLTDTEKSFVAYMEKDERHLDAGASLVKIGDPVDELLVLKFGWAVVRSPKVRGRSQILRIYLPGEVVGLAEVGRTHAIHELQLHTDGAVCPFPRSAMARMFAEAPRLAALLTSISSMDQLTLRERVVSLSRRTAEDQLIEFLVTLRDRLSVANVGVGNRFNLPFTQAEIGDILGLTSVYVNKLFKKLREEGRIEIERRTIRLLDREGMEKQVGYVSIYDDIDTSWYPHAA